MPTTADLQTQRDALNQARATAEAIQQNLQSTADQLTAAKAAIDAATANINTLTTALNNDTRLVAARAAAAARAALGPAISAAKTLVAGTDKAISQFHSEGVR